MSASSAPASSPAPCPDTRRTAAYSSPTAATPMSACGTSRLQDENPKIRAEISIGHSDAGGLSTVIAFSGSRDPKKNAVQSFAPACTAAA